MLAVGIWQGVSDKPLFPTIWQWMRAVSLMNIDWPWLLVATLGLLLLVGDKGVALIRQKGTAISKATPFHLDPEFAEHSLLYLGVVEDEVGPYTSDDESSMQCKKDGRLDGTFELRIGPMNQVLTSVELRSRGGGIWTSAPDSRYWVLGVSRSGKRLNQNGRVFFHEGVVGGMMLELFASDDVDPRHFPHGMFFEAHVRFEGVDQPLKVPAKRLI